MSQLDVDHYVGNLIDRIDALERRLADIERAAATGLFDGTLLDAPGAISLTLTTEDVEVTDSGVAAATEQGWIEVDQSVTGTGYIRIYAAK